MTATLSAKVTGAAGVNRGLDARTTAMLTNLQNAIKRAGLYLVGYIKSQKLSDQVLHVRTGTLRRSIIAQFTTESGSIFSAVVGTTLKYARAHEYGINQTVQVPEHQRIIKQAFGRPLKETVTTSVRAHAMQMHLMARPFMRPSLQENREKITQDLRSALIKGLR